MRTLVFVGQGLSHTWGFHRKEICGMRNVNLSLSCEEPDTGQSQMGLVGLRGSRAHVEILVIIRVARARHDWSRLQSGWAECVAANQL
jgi:hypothetical protein